MRRDVLPVNHRSARNECAVSGSTNAEGDDASGEETFCVATLCGANERASSGYACVPCEGGSTNDAGDDASGPETFCECGENQRVAANECVACPNGETRSAGDPCPAWTRRARRSHAPRTSACSIKRARADGSANDAGDDASGRDTSCACVENRHVTDTGTCEECPEGTVRAAGDRIADGETACDPVCVFVRPENGGRGTCEDTLAANAVFPGVLRGVRLLRRHDVRRGRPHDRDDVRVP